MLPEEMRLTKSSVGWSLMVVVQEQFRMYVPQVKNLEMDFVISHVKVVTLA
jgi:hypothetical protein